MNSAVPTLLALALALVGAIMAPGAEAAPLASADEPETLGSQELGVLAKLLPHLQALAHEANDLAAAVGRVAAADSEMDLVKRQGAWDMDYGWGGGRFGKRQASSKRYDSFGIAGRFGRSAERADRS